MNLSRQKRVSPCHKSRVHRSLIRSQLQRAVQQILISDSKEVSEYEIKNWHQSHQNEGRYPICQICFSKKNQTLLKLVLNNKKLIYFLTPASWHQSTINCFPQIYSNLKLNYSSGNVCTF